MPSPKRSIVMVDWSRQNEPTARTRDLFLWDLMLLSLLYDDVLALDETVVCSKRLPKWFSDSESFRLFEEAIECGGFGLLKRPLHRYPQELQELAQHQPIAARRQHLERFSVNNAGAPLRFDDNQEVFHSRLEAFLKARPRAHRHAGEENKLGNDLMHEFGTLLASVLTDARYQKWLRSTFSSITPAVADDFVRFIHEPGRAIEHLHRERPGQPPAFTPRAGKPVFDTAVAVQVAATYKAQAQHLQDLIETVFARPFCQDEGADGRYGRNLRDLPMPLNVPEGHAAKVVKVETQVAVPLTLPWPGAGFSEIIATVRESTSGKMLRAAMGHLGDDSNFERVKTAWFAVADEIASKAASSKMKKIDLRLVIEKAGAGAALGALADFTLHITKILDDPLGLLQWGAAAGALHDVYSLGGDLYSNIRADDERQQFREQLERSVNWACVPHPIIQTEPRPKAP